MKPSINNGPRAVYSRPNPDAIESNHRISQVTRHLMPSEKIPYTSAIELAEKMYNRRIKDEIGDALNGQWIVIDVNSGEYEINEDGYVALETLEARLADVDHVFVRDGEFLPGDLLGLVKVVWSNVPQEEIDALPHDGSLNYKHYLYGFPKRDKYPWEE